MNKYTKLNIINTIRQAILKCPSLIEQILEETLTPSEKDYLYLNIKATEAASIADLDLFPDREDILTHISRHTLYKGLAFYVAQKRIESKSEKILQDFYNTEEESCLYYKEGRFYVNHNPYFDEEGIPESGIPVTHENQVWLLNMSDGHTTAVVLGNDEKVGLFNFDYAFGMQGFRYVSDEDEPFPFDEIRYAEVEDKSVYQQYGYFACRKGSQWSVVRIGDKDCPHSRTELLPLAERSFEETIDALPQIDNLAPLSGWGAV